MANFVSSILSLLCRGAQVQRLLPGEHWNHPFWLNSIYPSVYPRRRTFRQAVRHQFVFSQTWVPGKWSTQLTASVCLSVCLSVGLSQSECWSRRLPPALPSVCLAPSSSWLHRHDGQTGEKAEPEVQDLSSNLLYPQLTRFQKTEIMDWVSVNSSWSLEPFLLLDCSIDWWMEIYSGWWTSAELWVKKKVFYVNYQATK